jgi:uncharacterized tellurite resistance protein B-like protein
METERAKWSPLQYSGDREDMQELYAKYNVQGFLDTRKEGGRAQGRSFRDALLKDGVLLNQTLSPRIFDILGEVQRKLEMAGDFEVICVKNPDVNAFAYVGESEDVEERFIGITSGALEHLEDAEIAYLLGHELGHFIFNHNELLGLLNQEPKNPKITVLPYMGECLFLRWRKKGEISADRAGVLASGSFEASARALIKAGFGLSDRNLNLDIDSLLKQIEDIKDQPEVVEAAFRSHPLLPLRLKALDLFSGVFHDITEERLGAIDSEIRDLFSWYRRYPRRPLHEAIMRVVALVGMKIISCEDRIHDEEVRTIVHVLHANFTDEPEKELILDAAERQARLESALETVNSEGDQNDKHFIICRLADIALADGNLLKEEAGHIIELAELLGIPARSAYGIMVSAAQVVGFQEDSRMKEMVGRVKSSLVDQSKAAADLLVKL